MAATVRFVSGEFVDAIKLRRVVEEFKRKREGPGWVAAFVCYLLHWVAIRPGEGVNMIVYVCVWKR